MGRVYDNWMIGVTLTNRKLQGARVADTCGGFPGATRGGSDTPRWRQSGHNLDVALIMVKGRYEAAPPTRDASLRAAQG